MCVSVLLDLCVWGCLWCDWNMYGCRVYIWGCDQGVCSVVWGEGICAVKDVYVGGVFGEYMVEVYPYTHCTPLVPLHVDTQSIPDTPNTTPRHTSNTRPILP